MLLRVRRQVTQLPLGSSEVFEVGTYVGGCTLRVALRLASAQPQQQPTPERVGGQGLSVGYARAKRIEPRDFGAVADAQRIEGGYDCKCRLGLGGYRAAHACAVHHFADARVVLAFGGEE